jgi:hypothetical protein
MRQYRITSADINQDSPDDCYIDPKDPIHEMKAIAHLGGLGADARLHKLRAEQGSNISVTGTEKRKIERELNLRPGDPEWFQLWFSLPKFMEGERAVGAGYRGIRK